MSTQSTSPILELQRQQLLLQMEYDEERKAFDQKAGAIGIERLIARGDAWWPVRMGRSYYNSLNQLCVELFRTITDEDDEDHNFEFGKPVAFFLHSQPLRGGSTGGNSNPSRKVDDPSRLGGGGCTVSFVDGNRMVVAVPDGFPLADLQQEGVGI